MELRITKIRQNQKERDTKMEKKTTRNDEFGEEKRYSQLSSDNITNGEKQSLKTLFEMCQ
jgi:hypothetical protein